MSDTSHHVLTGKLDITSNLLVGSSHLFVDTNNNRVGLVTTDPHAGLHVNSNAYVNTDLRVGPTGPNQVVINATAGRIKAASFEGDGSLLQNTPPGADGADGAAATIAVGTTTTGAAGSSASVTNSGTSSAAVFNFTIPKGDQGIQGIPGNDGDDGAPGADGTNYFTLSGSDIYRSTGNVGISTTTPMTKLDIAYNAAAPAIVFSDTTNSRYQTGIGSFHVSNEGQRLDFYTGDSSTNGTLLTNTPRMCITGTGNVGVGASSPQQNLHVHESGSGQVVIAVTNDTTGSGNNDGIHFGIDSSEQGFVWHKQNTALLFATNNTERMRIANGGSVGIGTTTPHGALDVRGAVTITTPTQDSVATKTGYMAAGSLNIGSVAANFGGGQGWNGNTAGLMLECADNTEIAVHDSGTRVASFMYFQGANTNMFTIGRDMGWGTTKTEFGESGKRNLFYAPSNWSYSTTSTGGTILWSFTYNFPYDGYCIFNTNGHFHNSIGNRWVYAKVVIDSAETANTSGYYDSYTQGGAGGNGGDFHAYKDTSVSWQDFNWGGTLKVSAGNRTIGLHVKVNGGTVQINGAAINMFYIPTKIF